MKRRTLLDYQTSLDLAPLNFEHLEPGTPPTKWLQRVLELTPSVIALVLYLLGIAKQEPFLSKLLLVTIIATVALLPIRYAAKAAKNGLRWWTERRFTAREDEQLRKRIRRSRRFTSSNDSRSPLSILRSVSADCQEIGRLLNSYQLETWIECFRRQMAFPPRSMDEFLQRACEFQALISTFNRSFVLVVQKELAALPKPIQAHFITQLEAFREDFNRYLDDLEEWGQSITEAAQKLKGGTGLDNSKMPLASFDRVPTFRADTTILVNGR